MPTMSRTGLKLVSSKLSPADPAEDQPQEGRTLWRALLRVDTERDEFLFRAGDDFPAAANEALRLVSESPSCTMCRAVIIAVERVARLWN